MQKNSRHRGPKWKTAAERLGVELPAGTHTMLHGWNELPANRGSNETKIDVLVSQFCQENMLAKLSREKQYSDRFRDWLFPVECQRENRVKELYTLVIESLESKPTVPPPRVQPIQPKFVPPARPEVLDLKSSDFTYNQLKQQQAFQIMERSNMDSSHVDPETGDNILHALSRIQLNSATALLSKIQDATANGADLNLHNRDGYSPLVAFIVNRPFQEHSETGAILSKYLDALLWKDNKRRIPNKINVNMRNRKGATALYYAAIRGRLDSVRSLIEAGANVNARLGN
jgi:hypothetical protein